MKLCLAELPTSDLHRNDSHRQLDKDMHAANCAVKIFFCEGSERLRMITDAQIMSHHAASYVQNNY